MSSLSLSFLAARAAGFRPSPVRDIWEVSVEPGVISLAGGNPDLSVLPLDLLGEVLEREISNNGMEVLQYGPGNGTVGAREAAAQMMAAEGIRTDPGYIQITAGSQTALDLVVKLLTDPGDVILAEGPSYVGAIGIFSASQVDVVHVPMDSDGIVPSGLEDTIRRIQAAGRHIKALYTIPNFHNPSGITLTSARRPEVVRICKAAGIAVIEDNPYGLLSFDGTCMPSLHELDPGNVIYLGSFSKTLSPGVRVGWAVVPEQIRRPLQLASESHTICPSVLTQTLVEKYILECDWYSVIERARRLYADRAAAILGILERDALPGVGWSVPSGGFFSWLSLPEGVDVQAVLDVAIDRRVVFVPGTAFYADGGGSHRLRVSFSLEKADVLAEGMSRIMQAVQEVSASNAGFAGEVAQA